MQTVNQPEAASRLAADPVELLAELVRIDSVNPDLVPGAPGEGAIADYVTTWLTDRGFEVTRLETIPGRPSVVAMARGTGGGRSLMFNGHLDTVTLAGYDGDPLDPVIRDGRMYGRGTFDMKAGIAAMMVAAATAAQAKLRGDVMLALVADEEYASTGTEEVLRRFGADAAVVCEPTHEQIVVAHRGFAWFDVEIHGTAAHGSRPDLGVDAIAKAGHFLAGLDALADELAVRPPHPLLGTGNIHASVINGGEEISSYPASCRIQLERRTLPGEDSASVAAELEGILSPLRAKDPNFSYTLTAGLERHPFEVPADHPIVAAVQNAARAVLGAEPVVRGEAFWTDAALLQQAGIPGLLFGVDGGGAHAATEWIEIDSLWRNAIVLSDTTLEFCG